MVGLTTGGLVVALFGVNLPIEYDAVTFFAAALLLPALPPTAARRDPSEPSIPSRFLGEFSDGLRFLKEHRFLLELIVLEGAVNFFGNGEAALFAPHSKLVLHSGAGT
ncbi:MAG: hypothetical protein ACYDFT_00095 [Thermoplasmata archaeon]